MAKGGVKFHFTTREFGINVKKLANLHEIQAQHLMMAIRDTIVKAAKDRVPFKEGILHASITGDVVVNKKSYTATCYVPINSPAADYAIWIHEGDYNLGEGSIAHQEKTGCTVGPKFITRGIEDNKGEIAAKIKEALKL